MLLNFKIGLRNLFRNKRRTMITLSILIFGLAGLLVFAGYVDYSLWGLRESSIRRGLGHLQVYQKGYNEKKGDSVYKYLIENPEEIQKYLLALPYVLDVAPQLTLRGLITTGDKSEMCSVKGIDPEREKSFQFGVEVTNGKLLEKEDTHKIIIGELLAEKLNAKVGTVVTLMATTKYGSLNALDFEVKAINSTGVKELDEISVLMPIDRVKELLDVQGVEKFIILLDKTELTGEVHKKIDKIIEKKNLNLEVKEWEELAVFYRQVRDIYKTFFMVTEIILIVIVIFSIMNTMSMIIFERMREIGTVKALGLRKKGVISMFLCEAIWIGAFGVLLGCLVGFLIASIINACGGIYVPPPPSMTKGYYSLIDSSFSRYIEAGIVGLSAILLGSIFPAIKAAKIKIVDALRYI